MPVNSRNQTTLISDPHVLAGILEAVIQQDFGDNLSAAARSAGISQPTLHRLRHAGSRALSAENADRLLRFLSARIEPGLAETLVVSAPARDRLAGYRRWKRTVLDEIRVGRSFGVVYLPQGGVRRRTGDHLRTREYREVLLHLHQYAPDVINYFRTKAARFKHEPDRIELSIARAISPLVDAVESAYVERSWRELSLIELRRIVERGLSVELILLRRSPETARAQELAGRRGSSRAYINLAVRLVG